MVKIFKIARRLSVWSHKGYRLFMNDKLCTRHVSARKT